MLGELMPITWPSPAWRSIWLQALRPPSPPTLTTLTGTSTSPLLVTEFASARADRSRPPPGGVPAMISTARSGFQVIGDKSWGIRRLHRSQHLGPEIDFRAHEFVERGRRALLRRHHVVSQIREPLDDGRVIHGHRQRPVELLDSGRRRALGRGQAVPDGELEIRQSGL